MHAGGGYDEAMRVGAEMLLNGDLASFDKAIMSFDEAIKLNSESLPLHWQRGLALYYVGRFVEGSNQFAVNMQANGSDVEEVVWRWMCDIRCLGLTAARTRMLPCGVDSRVPMSEILGLFSGSHSVVDVTRAAEACGPDGSETKDTAVAYASLYCGLYFEALGIDDAAASHFEQAAKFPSKDYMGKLSQMHWRIFQARLANRIPVAAFGQEEGGDYLPYTYPRVIVGGWQLSAGHHNGFDAQVFSPISLAGHLQNL
jgi:lipoprotein NlpI